jgi:hypothetical protein
MIEGCVSCKYLSIVKEEGEPEGHVCILHLDETTLDDYCPCWDLKGD